MSGPDRFGVTITGTGTAVPSKSLTNADLEKLMDTSDEWIVQRTGIRNRYICDWDKGEDNVTLAHGALEKALADAGMQATDLDLVILATMSNKMQCPAGANRLCQLIGAGDAGSFDLVGACCGFVFAMNTAEALMRTGPYKNVAVVGSDTLSMHQEYSTRGRGTAILFGDAAGAAVLTRTDNPDQGVIAQAMHSDGDRWPELYVPMCEADFPEGHDVDPDQINRVYMNGKGVFKFAVGTFPEVIAQTLDQAGLEAKDVDHYVCHQSNARILAAASERFGLSEGKLHVNIERFGNTVAASVPLVMQDLRERGEVRPGQRVMFVGFGGGLTWGTSLWQL